MRNTPFILFVFLGLFGCDELLPGDFACTDHIETLGVVVLDAQGDPLVLDSTKVIRLSDNTLLDFQIDEFPDMGIYYYLTDEYFDQISTDGEDLQFEGFSLGQSLNQVFKVKQGLCHVERISGPDTLRFN